MRILLFIVLISVISPVIAQEIEITPISTIPFKTEKFIGVDEYKNIYTTNGAVLYKSNAEKTLQFSDIQLGFIKSVDILNPLRITVFYDQFNTAVILDNRLNEITRINFNQLENFKNIIYARTASDRRLWIYNQDLQQLELFDYRINRVEKSSPPVSQQVLGMASNFNYCWLLTESELLKYNTYGSLIYKMPKGSIDQAFMVNDDLLVLDKGTLKILMKGDDNFQSLNLSEKDIEQFSMTGEILYIYLGDSLATYELKLPKI